VIFLLTAFQLNELAVDAGLIDSYFNKPLDFQQLRQALRDIPRLRASEKKTKRRSRSSGKPGASFPSAT